MKLVSLKSFFIFDFIILIIFIIVLLFGNYVWEFIHSYPNKNLYVQLKEDNGNIDYLAQANNNITFDENKKFNIVSSRSFVAWRWCRDSFLGPNILFLEFV